MPTPRTWEKNGENAIKVYSTGKHTHTIHAAVNVLLVTSSQSPLVSSPLHSSQCWYLAMSSEDEIARFLNVGTAESHALTKVITNYFAE